MSSLELWKPVSGYEGWYEVSNQGRVKRLKRGKGSRGEHILAPWFDEGYARVELHKISEQYYTKVHILVAAAFIGERPVGLEINHINGNKADNRVENLEYVTTSENQMHAYATHLHEPKRGEDHWKAKLTDEDVAEIRRLLASSLMTIQQIADRYGVRNITISRINTSKSWKHTADDSRSHIRTENRRSRKLTIEQVRAIRQLLMEGLPQGAIAERFGVTQTAISRIATGKRWKNST